MILKESHGGVSCDEWNEKERGTRVVEIETQDNQTRYVVVDEEGRLVLPIVRYLNRVSRQR